jgi:hypothetical protein
MLTLVAEINGNFLRFEDKATKDLELRVHDILPVS